MEDINERLDKLKQHIQTEDYLYSRGLSNEVNYSVFCYHSNEEMTVRHFLDMILNDQTLKCHIVYFDLYELMLEICQQRNILDRIPKMEQLKGSEVLRTNLDKICDAKHFVDIIHKKYGEHHQNDVLIIGGVGKVFPFLRVHVLLEAMQTHFNDIPVLVMYPGSYDGHNIRLFNKIEPEGHYRSFNIIEGD
ncbi:MAG: DUF1788 domain-containing protein [Erysipelotrichaceae bacterium]|nr:DUF1788 domain-containing protein [Erysipelotrichaceae bacterium]